MRGMLLWRSRGAVFFCAWLSHALYFCGGENVFCTGELIAYGNTGVCRIESIETDKSGSRYVLSPLYQSCRITLPVDSPKVFMRPLISKEDALNLIDSIPAIEAEPYHNKVMRQLTEHYEAIIKNYTCSGLIELTMSIYAKKLQCEREHRKFGAIDERYMKRAETLLFGELAAVLEIPRENVRGFIEDRLCGMNPFSE